MKVTAKAPANIAFIKYWGKKNEALRIPASSSVSMNLSEAYTITSVEFDRNFVKDEIYIDGEKQEGVEESRISKHIDLIRKIVKFKSFAKVVSKNNFPKGAGIASSASGFAALTVATAHALELNLSEKELSILARMGSGSACRSIPDGFVEWKTGEKSEDSYAYSLYRPDYWDIYDLIAVVSEKSKKVSSTEGHAIAESSPFYKSRIKGMKNKVSEIKKALGNKDFTKFGEILEAEAISMHAVMMTSKTPLFYWLPKTLDIILAVREWRDSGLEAYFTIDAGPNVHIICQGKDSGRVVTRLHQVEEINKVKVMVNKPALGAKIINNEKL